MLVETPWIILYVIPMFPALLQRLVERNHAEEDHHNDQDDDHDDHGPDRGAWGGILKCRPVFCILAPFTWIVHGAPVASDTAHSPDLTTDPTDYIQALLGSSLKAVGHILVQHLCTLQIYSRHLNSSVLRGSNLVSRGVWISRDSLFELS